MQTCTTETLADIADCGPNSTACVALHCQSILAIMAGLSQHPQAAGRHTEGLQKWYTLHAPHRLTQTHLQVHARLVQLPQVDGWHIPLLQLLLLVVCSRQGLYQPTQHWLMLHLHHST